MFELGPYQHKAAKQRWQNLEKKVNKHKTVLTVVKKNIINC